MTCWRQEHFGGIAYFADYDEFIAFSTGTGLDTTVDRPISAGCLVTGRCNLNCPHCYGNREALPKTELSEAQWRLVFARMRSLGLMRVDISGGEPFVRRDILGIIEAALDAELNVVVSTNGTIMRQGIPADLPRSTRVHVSLDSGFEEIHTANRALHSGQPSVQSFQDALRFITECLSLNLRVRVLTSLGKHNAESLFQLGELLATLGVLEWNLSDIIPAGRAKEDFEQRWAIDDELARRQVAQMQEAYPWIRIRHSSRVDVNGYFLLILPDGTLATQMTDHRDKVIIGHAIQATLNDLRQSSVFSLDQHGRKWINATVGMENYMVA